MYAELYSYLILYKKLPVPGIGTFLLQRQSATGDYPNKRILPPSYSIVLDTLEQPASYNFFKWLSHSLSSSDQEAIIRFNDFAFELRQQVSNGAIINWNDVGTISKGLGGAVKFESIGIIMPEEPVIAEKVIREKSEHMVRVGEDQRTSEEMTTFLNQDVEKKSIWWAAALVIGILAMMFLGWHFSENGVATSSTANSKIITPVESLSSYKLLP